MSKSNPIGQNKIISQEIPENWNEDTYLKKYEDVAQAVSLGQFASGYAHFLSSGLWEGRDSGFTSADMVDSLWPWSSALYLENNPGLNSAIALKGITAADHYKQSGKNERRATGLESRKLDFINRTGLPEWALDEFGQQSEFEPGLDFLAFPEPLHYSPLSKTGWTSGIFKIRKYLRHERYDFLFFLPWLKKGGADLASLYHINAVSNRGFKVAVVLTEDAESEWTSRLPPGVDFIPFGEIFGSIELRYQAQLIYHLVSALSASKIHIINSTAAWEALNLFSLPLKSIADVYVSLYCYDYTEIDEPVGYARNIRKCIAGITGVYTDNTTFKDHLVNEIGLDQNLIHVLPHPVPNAPVAKPYPHLSRKILWASRLDRQKQPEILIEIAKKLPFVTFDVYGSAVLGLENNILKKLQDVPNIVYKGAFSSPNELTKEQYRCFLYTSLWDGMPNILLEMLWAGMLVIAPDVGGINADLGPERCLIVRNPSSSAAYVEAIRWIIENPDEAENIRIQGQKYVKARHGIGEFENVLSSSNYFPNPIKKDASLRIKKRQSNKVDKK